MTSRRGGGGGEFDNAQCLFQYNLVSLHIIYWFRAALVTGYFRELIAADSAIDSRARNVL